MTPKSEDDLDDWEETRQNFYDSTGASKSILGRQPSLPELEAMSNSISRKAWRDEQGRLYRRDIETIEEGRTYLYTSRLLEDGRGHSLTSRARHFKLSSPAGSFVTLKGACLLPVTMLVAVKVKPASEHNLAQRGSPLLDRRPDSTYWGRGALQTPDGLIYPCVEAQEPVPLGRSERVLTIKRKHEDSPDAIEADPVRKVSRTEAMRPYRASRKAISYEDPPEIEEIYEDDNSEDPDKILYKPKKVHPDMGDSESSDNVPLRMTPQGKGYQAVTMASNSQGDEKLHLKPTSSGKFKPWYFYS